MANAGLFQIDPVLTKSDDVYVLTCRYGREKRIAFKPEPPLP